MELVPCHGYVIFRTNDIDYQNRAGNKGAGIASASEAAIDRRERLRRLAMETIDISKVCSPCDQLTSTRIHTFYGIIWVGSSAVCA